MSKISGWWISVAMWVTYFYTSAMADVGRTLPESIGTWYSPYEMIIVTGLPALFGYLAGREESK